MPQSDEAAPHEPRSDDRVPPALHELEAEVMEVVWERGEASVREVMEAVDGRTGKRRAYTTYMTIMVRLAGKELLARRRDGKTDLYRAVYVREQYADLRARAEVDSLVDEFGELALAHIARQMAQLDPRRRRALQHLGRKR